MNAKKLELIQQMLAKAESTTPEEAEALTEAATKLMARHGIDAAMLAANQRSTRPEEIIKQTYFFAGTYAQGFVYMAHSIVQAFKTQRMVVTRNAYERIDGKNVKGSRIHVIGFESEVEHTMMLIQSLHMQAVVAQSAWWKGFTQKDWMTAMEKFKARRQFFISFGDGVAAKIREAMQTAQAETDAANTTGGPSTALVLRDRKAEVDTKVGEFFGSLGKSRGIQGGGFSAADAGRTAGRNANIGQKGVGAGRAAIGR